MSWRTVVITKTSKLDYSLGYMVVRDLENTVKIHISEITKRACAEKGQGNIL